MTNKPSLKQFEYFLTVAQCQGFSAAAKQLAVSKTAVSNTIKQLEKELGVDLLIRTTRKVSLTEEGQLLLNQCQKLRQQLDITRNLVGSFHSQPSGLLTLSCNPFFAETHLMPLVFAYQKAFPKVRVEILLDERMPNMAEEMVDIVFGVNWPAPPEVVARPIAKTRYVLCAAPQYLKEYGTPSTINELSSHHFISHLGRQSPCSLVQLKQQLQPKMQCNLALNHIGLIKSCVLQGKGISQFHDYMVQEELADGALIELLAEKFYSEIPLYIYYQKHRFIQPKIRQFVKLVFP